MPLELAVGEVFFRRFRKGGLLLAHGQLMLRQSLLNFPDPLDEQLNICLFLPCFRNLLHLGQIFQLGRLGFGQIQRQLSAAGADELIQNAGGQDNGL